MNFTPRQTATVLFALRLYQAGIDVFKPTGKAGAHFDKYKPLDKDEVDELCEAINFDGVRCVARPIEEDIRITLEKYGYDKPAFDPDGHHCIIHRTPFGSDILIWTGDEG